MGEDVVGESVGRRAAAVNLGGVGGDEAIDEGVGSVGGCRRDEGGGKGEDKFVNDIPNDFRLLVEIPGPISKLL